MIYLQRAKIQNANQWLDLIQQNRIELETWMPHLKKIQTEEAAKKYIQKNAHLDFYLGVHIYEIWEQGALVGLVSLHSGRITAQRVELAYWLGAAYRGKGLASAACQLLISKTFVHYPIQAIYINCLPHNKASQGVATQLNFDLKMADETLCCFEMDRKKWLDNYYDAADLLGFLEEIIFP